MFCRGQLCRHRLHKVAQLYILMLHVCVYVWQRLLPLSLQTLLKEITLGGLNPSLPEETRDAFNKWYKEQTKGQVVPSNSPPGATTELRPGMQMPRLEGPTVTPTALAMRSDNPMNLPTYSLNRTRMRTSFDPDNEIPRLQKWFQENEHPSRDQMLLYLQELNVLESRRDRKPLDLTNIVYWFKNARAAQRRATKTLDTSNDDVRSEDHSMEVDENENETLNEHLSPSTSPEPSDAPTGPVPVLPNRNAVYVVKPLEMRDSDEEVIRIRVEDMDEPEKASTPIALSLTHTVIKPGDINSRTSTPTPSNPDYSYSHSHKDENEQEEATDLSIRSRRDSSDSCTTVSSLQLSHSGSSFKLNGSSLKREREEDDEEDLSSSNAGTPSPPRSLPQMQQLQQHHALQMAAMSHAFGIQYMHPASVYSPQMVSTPFPSKEVKYPPPNHTPPSDCSMDKGGSKKRSRVFIDPLTEIPKMEKWFIEDTHPSSYMIEKYTDELNRSPYRQRFPKLEPKNVQLWFKNHRAKVKRARLEMANNNTESGQLSHAAITESYNQAAQSV